ncbi:MAG: ankyrin repeat domain-containing protein, partial [Candidatus Riflebacteria bacterium]|nr:ankyrin repeat domain-containing protein [Candidatus Riflebacteria bacterium]
MGNKNYEIKNRKYNDNYNNDFEERGNIYEEDDNYESYESESTYQSQDSPNFPKGDQFVANLVKLFIFLFLAIFGTGFFIAFKFFDDQVNKEEENNNLKPQILLKNDIEDYESKDNGYDMRELEKKNKVKILYNNTAKNNEYKTPKVFKLIDNKSSKDEKKSIQTNADKSFEENKLKEFKEKFIDKKENKSKFEKEFVPTIPREATGPKKDIDNYYYLTEEQLIKEVNDSFKIDYDYYIRGTKYNRGQVKATLSTITQQKNYLKLLELLLTKGFATNFMGQNEDFDILSMTYYHAATDNREYLEILLKHGGDLKSVQYDGMTILHAAAMNNNIDLAKRVLDAGVPIEKKNNSGKTPLYYAIKNNCYDMVKFLVENGAKIEEEYKEITNDRNILGFLASHNNKSGNNNENAPYSFPENEDWEEAFEYIKNGDISSLKVLEISGQDLSKMFYDGEPAPCIAVKYGRTEILDYLTSKYDCNKLVDKINGRNVLHYAVMYYKPEMLKSLLRNEYNPNAKDNLGNTQLHYAAENSFPDYCRYLLKYGADAKILNNKKRNPLFFAANTENTSVFNNLIEKGANIDQQDIEGNTPLHYSVNKNLKTSAEKLLQLGADKDITNLNNQTPMDLATLADNTEIISLLEKYKYNKKRPKVIYYEED